jgi:hypothetical protein
MVEVDRGRAAFVVVVVVVAVIVVGYRAIEGHWDTTARTSSSWISPAISPRAAMKQPKEIRV